MPTPDPSQVHQAVDALRTDIVEISRSLHRNPELGLSEHHAHRLLTSRIEALGFEVTTPVAGLDTGFVARYGDRGPVIALLAEYDALPDLGHACGHNVIAAASFGAAAALRDTVRESGGTVLLVGTPDEEAVSERSKGGKVVMARAGVFDAVDAALMMHPTGGPNAVWRYTFPLKDFIVHFTGKPAHYTRPEEGINALEALLLFLNTADALRRTWPPDVLLAYTITDGGGPSAITVPRSAAAHLTLKTFDAATLETVFVRLEACLEDVSGLTGARGTMQVLDAYQSTVPNLHLCRRLHHHLRALGGDVENPLASQRRLERMRYPGISTDFGDVSRSAPAVHGYCSLGPPSLVAHTSAFAEAAGGLPGDEAALLSARALALTGRDLITDPPLAQAVRHEFEGYARDGFRHIPGLPPDYPPFPSDLEQALASE